MLLGLAASLGWRHASHHVGDHGSRDAVFGSATRLAQETSGLWGRQSAIDLSRC